MTAPGHPVRRDAQGALRLGQRRLLDLVGEARVSTPAYVYDLDSLAEGARALEACFGTGLHLTAYAVKASRAGTILREFTRLDLAADVASGCRNCSCEMPSHPTEP